MSDKGQTLPKFGDWDVNDPASAEGFTMIFNKARDEKKSGANPNSTRKDETVINHSAPAIPQRTNGSAASRARLRNLDERRAFLGRFIHLL